MTTPIDEAELRRLAEAAIADTRPGLGSVDVDFLEAVSNPQAVLALLDELNRLRQENARTLDAMTMLQRAATPLPAVEWTEEDGDVVWWSFPVNDYDTPRVGTLDDFDDDELREDGMPLHYTHWTPLVVPVQPEGQTP